MTGLAFYHLPKTGGRGIMTWIKDQAHDTLTVSGDKSCREYARGSRPWENPARFVMGHNVYTFMAPTARWVTIIRDPAERLFSYYWHYVRREKAQGLDLPPFEEWLDGGHPRAPLCTCLHCVCEPEAEIHKGRRNPMTWYYATRTARPIDHLRRAATTFLTLSTVFRTDRLEECVDWLEREHGFNRRRYEPLNVTGEGERISPEQRRRVYELHDTDWEVYQWGLGLIEGRALIA